MSFPPLWRSQLNALYSNPESMTTSSKLTSMSSPVSEPLNIPTDIFYEILLQSDDQDTAFFWLDCRRVSHSFHSAVEHVFAVKYLNQTFIHAHYTRGEQTGTSYTKFEFSHIDPTDSSRVIYKHSKLDERYREDTCYCLNTVLEASISQLEWPKILIEVQHHLNDTMLPDLRYSFDPQSSLFEISFNWKGMFSHFFREEREVARKINIVNSLVQAEQGDKLKSSEMWVLFWSNKMTVRRAIREERIKRFMTERKVMGSTDPGIDGDER
ncbi:uncharacterized protein EV420DRAFT_100333 [Desarmillaria tabescens]|uniref:Uncharacterized protein n=1 Tax=Armillaria tabescens TaxID=1929756 RepID=A0AA39NQZ1_ARMTA|nr:uncharacterized protein EV420DRAFT_100333 [Desarmillaria tabescens]KAK0470242.1 hypothetical protein EV420DRAFT_100333 [Desarmillaria tabescens]